MTLLEYYKMLDCHDWYYEFSDDFTVWQRGHRERKQIENVAKESDQHMELRNGFVDWLSDRGYKPEVPE